MITVILILISLILFTLMVLTLRIDRVQDSIEQLDEKFIKLEKDAMKITFNEPFSPQDENYPSKKKIFKK